VRDEVVDLVEDWSGRTEINRDRFIGWLGFSRGKYFAWRERYGKVNEHNGKVPRDAWLLPEERQAIIDYFERHPGEGYRRLTYMMMDDDAVYASPASVYRVLRNAGLLDRWNRSPSKKGRGFEQPLAAHAHWHVDIAYINLASTFYYMCTLLDGHSRLVIHWEIREAMKEEDIECIIQRAREKFPGQKPRIISDNGPQFIAKDFKEFIRVSGMSHVRTSPFYPQSNGKLERYHRTIKSDAIRLSPPSSLEEARRLVEKFVAHYNNERLHSAIGYIAPCDYIAGRAPAIQAERDRKLEAARAVRARRRENERREIEALARQHEATLAVPLSALFSLTTASTMSETEALTESRSR
jgi:transposase InsO family protein